MEKSGRAESFPPNFLMSKKFFFWLQCSRSLYTALAKQNYKYNQNQKLLQGIKWEENKKCNKKSQKATSRRKVNSGLHNEQWYRKEIS